MYICGTKISQTTCRQIAMGKTKPVSKQTFLKCRKNNNTFIRADWLDIFPEPIKFHVTIHICILHYCNKGLKIVCTFITRIDMDSESRSLMVWPPAKEKISKVWPLAKQSSLAVRNLGWPVIEVAYIHIVGFCLI